MTGEVAATASNRVVPLIKRKGPDHRSSPAATIFGTWTKVLLASLG
jgi:hypothetical protein